MKILQIISSGGMYGAEAVILSLSRSLNSDGHRSIVGVFANSRNPNLQLHDIATDEGIESYLVPCKSQFDRTTISRIRELAERTGAELIHSHGYKADVFAYLAFRTKAIPLISTCHTWYDNDPLVYLYGVLDRLVLRKFTYIVAVSSDVKQRLLDAGVPHERIELIRNGIDLRPFGTDPPSTKSDSSAEEFVIGLVGRLTYEKGVDIFLRAAACVLAEFPNAKFVVVGEGPDRTSLEKLTDELKIRANVSLLGRRDNMPSVYRSFDLMVSSSRQEGLPIAILEGMASGLPVIASSVGEVPTLIRDDDTGVLCPPGDSQALSSAIGSLLSDRDKRVRLGSAARQLVEDDYSAERMAVEYLRIYNRAISAIANRLKRKAGQPSSTLRDAR
jgi:glycosyltransferase involved in cell wall biosynthesis